MQNLFVYNPTCELAVANGMVSYQAPRYLQKFERDLEILPAYLASSKDYILVQESISSEFRNKLSELGIQLPACITKEELNQQVKNSSLAVNKLIPWGWSTAIHHKLKHLKAFCSEDFSSSPVAHWNETQKEIYSRKFALEILGKLLPKLKDQYCIKNSELPRVATSEEEVLEIQKTWPQLVLKSPWSASGRGLQVLRRSEFNRTNHQLLAGVLKNQGFVMVEKYQQKLVDFAFQFRTEKGTIHYQGLSFFSASISGQYEKNYLGAYSQHLDEEINSFLKTIDVNAIANQLGETLQQSHIATHYEGNFGVDALIFKDHNKAIRINPCLEINCRNNMGNLSLVLNKYLAPNSIGYFYIDQIKNMDPNIFHKTIEQSHDGKIKSGSLALTPIYEDSQFIAWMEVFESISKTHQ